MPQKRAVLHPPPPPPQYTPPKLTTPIVPAAVTQRVNNLSFPNEDKKKIPFVFGTQDVEGSVRYVYKGSNALYIVRVLALGARSATAKGGEPGGQIDALSNAYSQSGSVGIVGAFVRNFYPGALNQGVDATLAAADPTWNETLVYTDPITGEKRALSYVMEAYYNLQTDWVKGIPKWMYRLRGSQMYDSRTGTTAYTENLYVQWRFWELDPQGAYRSLASIDDAAFQAGANVADQAVAGEKRYATHFFIESGQVEDWRKMFRSLGDAYCDETNGKLSVIVDQPAPAPVASYNDTNYAADPEIEGGQPGDAAQLVNHVIVKYTNTTFLYGWKDDQVEWKSDGYAAGIEDEVPATYDFTKMIHSASFALRKAKYILYSGQDDYRLKVPWLANVGDRKLGDVVTQSIPERGIADNFRLISRDMHPENTSIAELQLITARKFDDTAASTPARVASTYPDYYATPIDIDPATVVITEEGYTQQQGGMLFPTMRIAYTLPPSQAYVAGVEFSFNVAGGEFRYVSDVAPLFWMNDVVQLGTYGIRLVVRTEAGKKSAGITVYHTIVGKTTPPADVLGLVAGYNGYEAYLWWQPSSDLDVRRYEIRRGGLFDTWSTAHYCGQTDSSHWDDSTPISGTSRYFVKAIDFADNYSTNASIFDVSVAPSDLVPASSNLDFDATVVPDGATGFVQIGDGSLVARYAVLQSGNLFVTTQMRSDAGPIAQRAYLCRTDVGRVAAETERAAHGYTLAQWRTNIDDPRRKGAPLWAPLPANASGEMNVASGSVLHRLAEHHISFGGIEHAGLDTPSNISPTLPFNNYGGTKTYGTMIVTSYDIANINLLGVRISTNSPYYQVIAKDDGAGAFFKDSYVITPRVIAQGGASTDGSGSATITFNYMNVIGLLWLSINAAPTSTSGVFVVVGSASNTGGGAWSVVFKAFDASGAALAGCQFRYEIQDNGGTTAVFWP
jgi:hypothetical protein